MSPGDDLFPLSRPLIGVTGRRHQAAGLYPDDGVLMDGVVVDAFFAAYASAIVAAGGLVVFLPRESDAEALVSRLDGVVLSGGHDLDPACYGGAVTGESTVLDPAQDAFDLAVARAALARGIPLLGTCRGHEVLNVALGGTLHDHGHPEHNARLQTPSHRAHPVTFQPDSVMHALYGPTVEVNSLHHQAIDHVAPSASVTGRATDGIVEAIEVPGHPAIGVQWHPEFHTQPDPILAWIVDTARQRATTPSPVAGARR
jgi:putative glutamine amidotransferase